jgi:drug/metabolite transporter (DMT)-like permease
LKNQSKAYLFASLTILSWSTVATAFKFGLNHQTPSQLVAGAAFTAVVILALALLIQNKWKLVFKGTPKNYLQSAFLGFLNPFFYYLILFEAYSILPAQVAQPINMIWPIVLVLISVPLLRQKLRIRSMTGLVISFAGVIFISSQGGGAGFSSTQIPAILLCLASSIVWSLYWILNVKDTRDELVKLFLNFSFSILYILIASLFRENPFPVGEKAWFWAAYTGTFEMGIAFIFWLKALQYSESTDKVSNLIYISPFISLIFIHYFVGEPVYKTTVLGLLLIVTGILVQNQPWKRNRRK